MDIALENKLRDQFYSIMNWTKKDGYWRKPKLIREKLGKGNIRDIIRCKKCHEPFRKESLDGNRRCPACSKIVILRGPYKK